MPSHDTLLQMIPLPKPPLPLSFRSLLVASFASGILFSAACSEVPEDGQCEKFLDHVIDLQVNAGSASEEDKIGHKKELKDRMKEQFVKQCETKIKSSQLACSLKATTLQDIEKCDS